MPPDPVSPAFPSSVERELARLSPLGERSPLVRAVRAQLAREGQIPARLLGGRAVAALERQYAAEEAYWDANLRFLDAGLDGDELEEALVPYEQRMGAAQVEAQAAVVRLGEIPKPPRRAMSALEYAKWLQTTVTVASPPRAWRARRSASARRRAVRRRGSSRGSPGRPDDDPDLDAPAGAA